MANKKRTATEVKAIFAQVKLLLADSEISTVRRDLVNVSKVVDQQRALLKKGIRLDLDAIADSLSRVLQRNAESLGRALKTLDSANEALKRIG